MNLLPSTDDNPIIIAVTGIIGAGKSTIIERLRTSDVLGNLLKRYYGGWAPKIICVREKSKEWEESGDLERFYSDPERHAFWFQTKVFDSYVDSIDEVLEEKPDIIIIERSMYCQRIFWEIQVELGRCEEHEDRAYRGDDLSGDQGIWCKWKKLIPKPDLILYAKTETLKATMDRVNSRGRDAETTTSQPKDKETGVTESYQQLLLEAHDKIYTEYRCKPFGEESIDCVHVSTDSAIHEDNNILRKDVIGPISRYVARVRLVAQRLGEVISIPFGIEKKTQTCGIDVKDPWSLVPCDNPSWLEVLMRK